MTHQNDQECIRAILDGEVQRYAVLVDRYKDLVYTVVLRMLKNTQDAEEIAQDVFVKAFEKLNTFQGKSKFSTWLYRIAYNKCLDTLSRKRRQPTTQAYEYNDTISEASVDSVIATIEAKELRSQLENCIEQLAAEDAFLITLYYFEEKSVEEIREITGLSQSNIKVKLYRSRKKLYTILIRQLPEEIRTIYEHK